MIDMKIEAKKGYTLFVTSSLLEIFGLEILNQSFIVVSVYKVCQQATYFQVVWLY